MIFKKNTQPSKLAIPLASVHGKWQKFRFISQNGQNIQKKKLSSNKSFFLSKCLAPNDKKGGKGTGRGGGRVTGDNFFLLWIFVLAQFIYFLKWSYLPLNSEQWPKYDASKTIVLPLFYQFVWKNFQIWIPKPCVVFWGTKCPITPHFGFPRRYHHEYLVLFGGIFLELVFGHFVAIFRV